ncbi:VCBS repeat-containing protein [Jiulongibacter sp. NS-SX5]|uniref:VCBS repeat-containing protein n=1 Tax=Jiulongibacter sp. NS-SX5 TaxID=3463854 RepID=UPI004059AE21
MRKLGVILLFGLLVFSCKKEQKVEKQFRVLSSQQTGITFQNRVEPRKDLNIFTYLYFYNGGGAGSGDLNNDGLIDLIFTSNLEENKIYLNKGKMVFEDITSQSGFDTKGGWSNGISLVDINNDGLLDIYISQVGEYQNLKGKNQLFECQKIEDGIPIYIEKGAEYGLDLVGFGTQAAFVDFDQDGDLDFFQLNHSVHSIGTFGNRANFLDTYHPLSGDRYYENVDGQFIDKTKESNIHSNALGYGLGLAVGDINLDGLPDLYVGNDFHENDYLYINQGKGTFEDLTDKYMTHTSRFSMGVDIADFNNDIFPDIVSLDMLPWDYKLIKQADGEDVFYNFNFKLKQGYNFQYSRNALQLNNGNNSFTEIAMNGGIHATDWSWSSLFLDFDNDGLKDLFISNGISKRMNDTDYMKYVSNDAIQEKINKQEFDESSEELTDLLPEVKIPNKFFRNNGNVGFEEINAAVENNFNSFSNGAIYADLDNDGDLDLVTNNINDEVFVYENLTTNNKSLTIQLKGDKDNINAIGAKVFLYQNGSSQYQEKFPVRGFQSSMETPLLFGLGDSIRVDSIRVIWPDNTSEIHTQPDISSGQIEFTYQKGLQPYNYQLLAKKNSHTLHFEDIAQQTKLNIKHYENVFNEFDREALKPFMHSSAGPAITVKDINGDGLEDVFIGSSKWEKAKVLLQHKDGTFITTSQKGLEADSTYEESSATWADINGDSFPDLLLASGGNEYYGKTEYLKARIFVNDGKGNLSKKSDALPEIFETQGDIITSDVDQDGDLDIFLAGKTVSWKYGAIPRSYLLINDGRGKFSDQTPKELQYIGMVHSAKWFDVDQDGDEDLILACQWDGVFAFINNQGSFEKTILTDKKGWWNTLYLTDIDQDGDQDILLGNLGENSRIKASEKEPVRLYVNDIDENGRLDQILTHYMNGEEVIFADKKELEKQMPFIRKKYNLSRDFSEAYFKDVFGRDKIDNATVFEANYFKNALLLNTGSSFELRELPKASQYGPKMAFGEVTNGQILMLGNFYESNIQFGRYDGYYGGLLSMNDGKINHSDLNNLKIKGQARSITPIMIQGQQCFIIARNDDVLMVIRQIAE